MANIFSILSWKDKLFTASFRGVPFLVENTDRRVGRRFVLHQFPFKEDAYSEDLGAEADEFVIYGYIAQMTQSYLDPTKPNEWDYFEQRDALIDVLRESGPGELVHPFYGKKNVIVKGQALIKESFNEGGMARFEMTFTEVKTKPVLERNASFNFITQIDDEAEVAFAKLRDTFADTRAKINQNITFYSKDNVATAVMNGFKMMEGSFSGIKGVISSTAAQLKKDIFTAISTVSNALNSACSFAGLILDTIDAPLSLIGIPDPVEKAFLGTCSNILKAKSISFPGDKVPIDIGDSMIDAYVNMSDLGQSTTTVTTTLTTGYSATSTINTEASIYGGRLEDITVNSPDSAAKEADRLLAVSMIKSASLINATRIAVRMEIDSYENMIDVLVKVTDAMNNLIIDLSDSEAAETFSDYDISLDTSEIVIALEKVKSNFVQIMRRKGASLAHIIEYKVPPTVMSSIMLAYDQYEDVFRENEIFERNKPLVRHPGFLPEGRTLDILNE